MVSEHPFHEPKPDTASEIPAEQLAAVTASGDLVRTSQGTDLAIAQLSAKLDQLAIRVDSIPPTPSEIPTAPPHLCHGHIVPCVSPSADVQNTPPDPPPLLPPKSSQLAPPSAMRRPATLGLSRLVCRFLKRTSSAS